MYKAAFITLSLLTLSGPAQGKTMRATEMTERHWSEFRSGQEELTISFRQGDELPVSLISEGDFLETSRPAISYVTVKRDFWLKTDDQNIQVSLDGIIFKPLKEVMSGSFTAGAGSDVSGPATAVNLVFKATLK